MYGNNHWANLRVIKESGRYSPDLLKSKSIRRKKVGDTTYINLLDLVNENHPKLPRYSGEFRDIKKLQHHLCKNIKAICKIQGIPLEDLQEAAGCIFRVSDIPSVMELIKVAYFTDVAIEDLLFNKYYE